MRYFSPNGTTYKGEHHLKYRYGKWSEKAVDRILDNIELYLKWEYDDYKIKFLKDYKKKFIERRTKVTMSANQHQYASNLGLFAIHEKPINDIEDYIKFIKEHSSL
tara:strand:+ start:506 stop:823 length:318 start_codon:yes stop_codon:yes gene_type:complete